MRASFYCQTSQSNPHGCMSISNYCAPRKCHFDLCFLLSMNPFPNSYISITGVLLNFRLHMVNVSEYAVLGGSCARFLTPTTRHDACMWVFLININHIFPFPLQTMLTAISMSAIATNGVVPGNNFNLLLQVYLLLVVLVLYFFFFYDDLFIGIFKRNSAMPIQTVRDVNRNMNTLIRKRITK